MKLVLGLALAVVTSTLALAEGGIVTADKMQWGPAPPVFPKGAQVAVVSGDPFKNGSYVLRLKMPANYKIPAHNHPSAEFVTVVSGSIYLGMGDKLDPKQGQRLKPGDFAEAPANMNHYAWTTAATVIQVHGQGPFGLTYVNPADDPSKK